MNERPLIMKMRQDYRFFGGISILYGIVFAFCLYKNTHGVTFPLCVAVTILTAGLFMRRIRFRLQKGSLPYIIGMILLGISTALTTSFFLHFFNLLGIVLLFFVLMIHQFYDDHDWNFPMYLKRIFLLFGTMVGSLPLPFSHGAGYFSRSQSKKKQTIAAIAVGCFVALGILCLVLPLLLKSDLVFSRIFGEILKYINFSNLLGIGITILLGFALGYGFFAALCKYNFPIEKRRKIRYFNPVVGITFTSIISVIYLMYCLIQIVYLFIGLQVGLPADLTYAEYARGGFWELLFVSIVNFIMVLLCLYLFKESLPSEDHPDGDLGMYLYYDSVRRLPDVPVCGGLSSYVPADPGAVVPSDPQSYHGGSDREYLPGKISAFPIYCSSRECSVYWTFSCKAGRHCSGI